MTTLRSTGDTKDEAQRHTAAQAAREVAELDVRSVRLTLLQWIANGEVERARAFWAAYKKGM